MTKLLRRNFSLLQFHIDFVETSVLDQILAPVSSRSLENWMIEAATAGHALTTSNLSIYSLNNHMSSTVRMENRDLSSYNLEGVTHSIAMTSLQNLYLDRNHLTNLDPALAELQNLQILSISGNLFTQIDPVIGRLTSLKELNLKDNRIKEITFDLFLLSELRACNLAGNLISDIPFFFGFQKKLSALDLSSNPIDASSPFHGIFGDSESLLSSLRNFVRSLEDRTIHAKVIILGPSNSGKSSLLESILTFDPKKKGTLSIRGKKSSHISSKSDTTISKNGSVRCLNETHNGRSICLNFYDIDGHDFLTTLHQYSLTPNAIYILTLSLLNLQKDVCDACLSLEEMSLSAPSAPLIIVVTNRDRSSMSDDEIHETMKSIIPTLRKFHNNISKIVISDSVTYVGIPNLIHYLLQSSMDLHWSQRHIPYRYKVLIDRVRISLNRDATSALLESELNEHASACATDDLTTFLSYVTQTGQFIQVA